MTTGEMVEHAVVPRVVSILSVLLQRVAERNDAAAEEGATGRPVSAFQGLTKPAISIAGYLERIFRFASCSPSCYVVAYIYLDRFLRRRPALAVDSFNVHRLLITSVLAAVKFVDDIWHCIKDKPLGWSQGQLSNPRLMRPQHCTADPPFSPKPSILSYLLTYAFFTSPLETSYRHLKWKAGIVPFRTKFLPGLTTIICYNNAYFARVGGISLVEMNYLEVDFLFGIAFDLNVTPAAFTSYCAVLQSEMAYLEPPPAPVEATRLQLQHYCVGPSSDHDVDAAAVAAAGCHRNQQPQLTV